MIAAAGGERREMDCEARRRARGQGGAFPTSAPFPDPAIQGMLSTRCRKSARAYERAQTQGSAVRMGPSYTSCVLRRLNICCCRSRLTGTPTR
jgi:hypothetical protein